MNMIEMHADDLPGNHSRIDIGPIAIMCMAPKAQDLMLKAEEGYAAYTKAKGVRQSVPGLLQWLFKESDLVDDIQEIATEAFEKHRTEIQANVKNHSNPKFRRSISRRSIHSFTYWFFRWSGLVDASGKATCKK